MKGPSEDSLHEAIKRGQELGKVIIAAGCVPQGQKDLPDLQNLSVIGVQQIDRVVEVVEESLKGNKVTLFGQKREGRRRLAGPMLDLPKIRRNPLIEIIPINSGLGIDFLQNVKFLFLFSLIYNYQLTITNTLIFSIIIY